MGDTGPNGRKRDMTYHVGWKKGKIRHGDGSVSEIRATDVELALAEASHSGRRSHRIWRGIWHPLPFFSWEAGRVLLALLPVVSLAATVWLVYALKHRG